MTLQQSWQNEMKVNVVTSIFGYNENEDPRNSAIPSIFDDWFHGDFRTSRPDSLSSAIEEEKTLEEYERTFPKHRINSVVEIGFDSDGQTISDYEVQTTDPDDPNTSGGLSPITLEGVSENPFRNEFDEYDNEYEDDFHPASVKGPHADDKIITVNGDEEVEGVRASLILGGSDPYLEKAKQDVEELSGLTSGNVPAALSHFFLHVNAFYSFIDVVFMADGTKVVHVWDASVYPAHALYVDGTNQDQNQFREGTEWVTDGVGTAFAQFAHDGLGVGRTPFDQFGAFAYDVRFSGGHERHPVMDHSDPGSTLSVQTVEDELDGPFFPLPGNVL
jgi:hypothetical protein